MHPAIPRRYDVLRKIGAGGMGVVYEALDRETGRRLAIKTLARMGASALLRFKQEFRSLADLRHPNLVQLYELQETNGVWFYTMELVDGENLIRYIRDDHHGDAGHEDQEGPTVEQSTAEALPTIPDRETRFQETSEQDETLDSGDGFIASPAPGGRYVAPQTGGVQYNRRRLDSTLGQLATALQAVHQDGKIHRDIKPSNILVTREGRIVLLDFGLVMGTDPEDTDHLTGAGLAGTAGYMAPEVAANRNVGPASDWYSLGVILYEILTGRLPFEGKAIEIILRKQRETPPSPLSVNPKCDGDLADLAMRLLAPDPGQRPGPKEILSRLGQSPTSSTSLRTGRGSSRETETFVGRSAELARFGQAWRNTVNGVSATLLVTGSSGIGKTALISRFKDVVRQTTQGTVFLFSSKCHDRETVPFKAFDPVVDRITSALVHMERRSDRLALPEDAPYLKAMFPVLGRIKAFKKVGKPERSEGGDAKESRKRAFGAFGSLLQTMALRRPVMIFLDDIQWIDKDSLELLEYLVHRFHTPGGPSGRFLMLLARRPEAIESHGGILADLVSDHFIEELDLGPLPDQEARALAAALLKDAGIATPGLDERIASESTGNPFFIGEMVRTLALRAEQGFLMGEDNEGLTLKRVLAERLSDISHRARRLLETSAVAGEGVPHRILAEAAGMAMSEPAWWDEISLLRSQRFVRCNGFRGRDIVETYHDKIRETLLARMDPDLKRRIHENLALTMEGETKVSIHALAGHWLAAGRGDRAREYVVQAAEQAADMFAFDRAAELYQQAIDLEEDEARLVGLYLGMGDALANSGQVGRAADAYARAAESAEEGIIRMEARYKAADQMLKGGYIDRGLEEIRGVLDDAGLSLPKSRRAVLVLTGIERARLRIRGLSYKPRHRSNISPERLKALDLLWSISAGLSVPEPVISTMFRTKMIRTALSLGDEIMVAAGLAMEASMLSAFGAKTLPRARRLVVQAHELVDRLGDDRVLGRVLVAHNIVSYFGGEWKNAVKWGKAAVEHIQAHCHGMAWEKSMANTFAGFALVKIGDMNALRDMLWPLLEEAKRSGDRFLIANMAAMDLAWLSVNKTEELARELEHVIDTWPKDRYQMHHWFRLFGRGELNLYLGRPEEAWHLIQTEEKQIGTSFVTWVALIAVQIMKLKGRVALALAEHTDGTQRQAYLKVVRKMIRGLHNKRLPYAHAWANLLEAGLEWQQTKDAATTERALKQAIESLLACDCLLDAQAARWRLGQVTGRDSLREEAIRNIVALGAESPERMAGFSAPGFPSA